MATERRTADDDSAAPQGKRPRLSEAEPTASAGPSGNADDDDTSKVLLQGAYANKFIHVGHDYQAA
eukprot:5352051-Prymnesium_polylepis.1